MPQHIVKQPNGKYAIFSSVVDHFVVYDATPEECRDHFRAQAIEVSDRATNRSIASADYFGLDRFNNDINTVRVIHGDAKADEVLALLGGSPAPDVCPECGINNGFHRDTCSIYAKSHGHEPYVLGSELYD